MDSPLPGYIHLNVVSTYTVNDSMATLFSAMKVIYFHTTMRPYRRQSSSPFTE